jgi:uncharacterized protein YegP (UPF0339 family)
VTRWGGSKFVLYRQLGDGYRWRLRGPDGETLAASETGHPTKAACEADLRALMADLRPGAEVLDTTPGAPGR